MVVHSCQTRVDGSEQYGHHLMDDSTGVMVGHGRGAKASGWVFLLVPHTPSCCNLLSYHFFPGKRVYEFGSKSFKKRRVREQIDRSLFTQTKG